MPLRVLIACEYSGVTRDAFLAHGHDAVSCDLLPSEQPGPHMVGDVLGVLTAGWDLMIGFPPCTYLAVSGRRWWPARQREQADALAFVRRLMDAPIPRIALENPYSIISSKIRKSDQTIQPWLFGEEATKTTCLWLKNLPYLQPTKLMAHRPQRCWTMGSTVKDRGRKRARAFAGIAEAMAAQWGALGPL